jgi:hypothetical protein
MRLLHVRISVFGAGLQRRPRDLRLETAAGACPRQPRPPSAAQIRRSAGAGVSPRTRFLDTQGRLGAGKIGGAIEQVQV